MRKILYIIIEFLFCADLFCAECELKKYEIVNIKYVLNNYPVNQSWKSIDKLDGNLNDGVTFRIKIREIKNEDNIKEIIIKLGMFARHSVEQLHIVKPDFFDAVKQRKRKSSRHITSRNYISRNYIKMEHSNRLQGNRNGEEKDNVFEKKSNITGFVLCNGELDDNEENHVEKYKEIMKNFIVKFLQYVRKKSKIYIYEQQGQDNKIFKYLISCGFVFEKFKEAYMLTEKYEGGNYTLSLKNLHDTNTTKHIENLMITKMDEETGELNLLTLYPQL